jgi:DNA-binding CsgD family transcriptional regulator
MRARRALRTGNQVSDAERPQQDDESARRERFIQRLCEDEEGVGFGDVLGELREVMPHRFFAYAVVRTFDGCVERLYNVDFPLESLRTLQLREECECEVVQHWLHKREPLLLNDAAAAVAIHAQLDLVGSRAIAFCLGDVPTAASTSVARDLKTLTPYLYAFAVRAIRENADARRQRRRRAKLTPRQVEVLRWLCQGKTNDEIAAILGISVFTVKNHVQRILVQLDASNRVQAASRASSAGLLESSAREPERR